MEKKIEKPEIVEAVPYKLRTLQASDMFTMTSLLSKIGINELKDLIKLNPEDGELEFGKEVIFETVQLVLANLSNCQKEVYKLLSNLSGMTSKEIEALPLDLFMNMITDVIQSDGFMGFIKAASKLFK